MADAPANHPAAIPPGFREERVALGELLGARRHREAIGLLYQLGRTVLSATSLEELNQLALSLVLDAVAAERGALLLRAAGGGEFVPQVVRRRDRAPLGPDELRVPSSIVHEVVSKRVGLLTADALHDPRFQARESVRADSIRSALCAPLWLEDQVLGVIYLDRRMQSSAFSREDLELVSAIANLVAIRLKQENLHAELTRERVVRANLERYHSRDVVDAILAGAKERGHPELGLEEREVTILFADLVSFTPFAESVPPAAVAEVLNEYYATATAAMFAHGGTVNEYVGDSLMTLFGAPIPHADHPQRAVDAALALLRGLPGSFGAGAHAFRPEVRVAINSGPVVVGSVGSPERLKYAVVGDPVNVAARLEAIAEPNTVVLGEHTRSQLGAELDCEDLGPLRLRGREQPVRAFRIRP